MADLAPLRPLRFAADDLSPLVAPPYDVISRAERLELELRSPHNVVRLILPEGEGDAKYGNAARTLQTWLDQKVLVRDEEPAYYRYRQTFEPPGGGARITRQGFLALVRLAPFAARVVLPHERTLSGPKEDRLKLFRATRTNLSPGFMLYRDPARSLDAPLATARIVSRFSTPDGVDHELAKVTSVDAMAAIGAHLAGGSLLIADGHHRYETALRYAEETDQALRGEGKSIAGRAEHHYFMVFLCNGDDPNLVVFPTHRLVHSLPAFDWDAFLVRARDLFTVEQQASGGLEALTAKLAEAGRLRGTTFGVLGSAGKMALLSLRSEADLGAHPTLGARPAVVRATDVAVLHSVVLEHMLGISLEAQAAKTHLAYLQDPKEGVLRLDRGEGQVLFLMNATPVAQVRAVAEAGEVMPQKSTYFYPKVLTGLAIHTLDPTRHL